MADKAISDLTPASSVGTADLFVLEQNSTAKKLAGQTLITYLLSMIDGHGGITSISFTESGTSGNGQYHYGTITYADDSSSTFTIRDGLKGDTGAASYVHISYASRNPIADSDMSTTPSDWMGIYSGTSASAPTSYTSYTWNKVRGDTGPGASITNVEVVYQASTSGTTPTGSWQNSIPSVNPGAWLWTRVTITFDSGSPISWTSVSYQGLDGTGSVNSVNGVNADASNNVSIDATDIPYNNSTVAAELASLASGASSAQAQINASGILKGAGAGTVSAATLGTDYGAKTFTVTLTANGWSSNAQTVSNANFLASGYSYMVSPSPSYTSDYWDSEIYPDDVTTNGSMTFHCSTVPSGGIVVNVIRIVSA